MSPSQGSFLTGRNSTKNKHPQITTPKFLNALKEALKSKFQCRTKYKLGVASPKVVDGIKTIAKRGLIFSCVLDKITACVPNRVVWCSGSA